MCAQTGKVVQDSEIFLGSHRYKLSGKITQRTIDAFPPKQITGEYDYANQNILSQYVIKDQRAGIGIEEMDEAKDSKRCWFSTLQLGYRGHLPLPRLATSITMPSTITPPTIVNPGFESAGSWTGGGIVAENPRSGSYSLRVPSTSVSGDFNSYQDLAWSASYQGQAFLLSGWARISSGTVQAKITIDDGVSLTDSGTITLTTAYQEMKVIRVLDAAATRFRVKLTNVTDPFNNYAFFDDITLIGQTIAAPKASANFNGILYFGMGNTLVKLNAARDGFTSVGVFPATITALIAGPNSMLYIYLGDSSSYWYMTTAEAFTLTNVSDANLGIEWDSKLFKLDTDGNFWYTTTPNSATPTWTSTGGITNIKSGDIKRLFIGPDASGNDIIYASTTSVLKAFDFTNGIWTDSYVKLPDHPTGGMGALTWRQGMYISYGLDVLGYVPINATVDSVGLSRDDGLPVEYNGEIVYFADGDAYLIALVDASKSSGSSKSVVYAWDGQGWQHLWSPPTTLIEDCEDAWVAGSNVTSTADTTDFQVGAGSAKLVVAAAAAAGDILATEVISSTDLSQHNSVSLRVKSSVACDASDLQLLLDDTALCASPLETLNLPALVANTWTKVVLTLAAASSDTAIISVGIKMAVDKGAFTLNIDQIEGQTYDGVMNSAIVSSASSGYAVYYDHNALMYYIDLQRGIRNINKLPATATYASSGLHISPWFDAGSAVDSKTAKRVLVYSRGASSTETIIPKYRINHTYTDLDTGWTTLGTITTNGKTTYTLGSGAGIAFDDKQFRVDLARGSTNTLTPDFTMVLEYLKRKTLWSWSFVIDASGKYDDQEPKAQETSLNTMVEAALLQEFTFRDDEDESQTHWVIVQPFVGAVQTGRQFQGQYQITVIEP